MPGADDGSVAAATAPAPAHTPLVRKVGSFQLFAKDTTSSEDIPASQFPDEEVQKVAILDIRLMNSDRNCDNLLVRVRRAAMACTAE